MNKCVDKNTTYHLLHNDNGIVVAGILNVLTERDKLGVTFKLPKGVETSALAGAYLVVDNNGKTFYRAIYDNKTTIPLENLTGRVNLAVSASGVKRVWKCEALCVCHFDDEVIVLPYNLDFESKLAEIIAEIDDINNRIKYDEGVINTFDERLTEIMDGYDFE